MMRHLIIGNSAAGISAAEAIRKRDASAEITILSDEEYPVYSRCLLTYYLGGEKRESELAIRAEGYYRQMQIQFRPGERAVELDPQAKAVKTLAGRIYTYDRLLVATGARPKIPYIHGGDCRAVFAGMRTLRDAKAMSRYTKQGMPAVVIGGGQVSLETASGLRKSGMDVTVICTAPQIFSQALDSHAASLVERHLKRSGIRFIKGMDVDEIVSEDGLLCAVKVQDGRVIPAGLVVIGKGVQPNTDILRGLGADIGAGIRTDRYLRTTIPDVYAAGDVVESHDLALDCLRVNAIWPNATEQGTIAGINMAGGEAVYPGSLSMNSAELFGYNVMACGASRGAEPDFETVSRTTADGSYRRLVFRGDTLAGYILAGDTANAGLLTALIREKRRLGAEKEKLIAGQKAVYALFYPDKKAEL